MGTNYEEIAKREEEEREIEDMLKEIFLNLFAETEE